MDSNPANIQITFENYIVKHCFMRYMYHTRKIFHTFGALVQVYQYESVEI